MLATLDAHSRSVDVFPIVKHYMNELKMFELFKKYVPKGKAELEPAEGLCLMVLKGQPASVRLETEAQLPPVTLNPSKAQNQTPSDSNSEEFVSELAQLTKVIEPIESQTTGRTKTEDLEASIPDKPINSTPVYSAPLAVPFKPEITGPSVLPIEASTHSPPKVTSVPRFKPLKPNLPDVPIMGLPILPHGMKTSILPGKTSNTYFAMFLR